MAKVSTETLNIYSEKVNEKYKVDINYTSSDLFYIKIPENFNSSFDHLSDEDRKTFNCHKIYKCKYRSGPFIRVVNGLTEKEAVKNTINLLNKLTLSEIVERPVIIIFTDLKETTRNHHTSQGFDPTGLEFGLSFCVETSVAGGEKKFYEYTTYTTFGEERINKREIHIWNSSSIIIDDTKENREFVVKLYGALKELKNKMEKFTKSEKDFLQLIASGQKLLGGS